METNIKSFSYETLHALAQNEGWPRFRADQLFSWLYQQGVTNYDEMTNLPKSLRDDLKHRYPLSAPSVVAKQTSTDGSRKYLISYADNVQVETVGIPSHDGSRLSVCVSTQAGCVMGCTFCATAQQQLVRNLLPGEIVDQVFLVQNDFGQRVSNVVVMGQGEPFLNYDNTIGALRILNNPKGLAIGARHITVSTCGIIPGIAKFATEPEQFTLAVSLHAAIQPLRDTLMPGLTKYPLNRLKTALTEYQQIARRRITFEYIMIKDVNDTPECLTALKAFCKDLQCHVNLLPFNTFEESPFVPSHKKTLEKWTADLSRAGIEATIRNSRGSDIAGACGQLNTKAGRH